MTFRQNSRLETRRDVRANEFLRQRQRQRQQAQASKRVDIFKRVAAEKTAQRWRQIYQVCALFDSPSYDWHFVLKAHSHEMWRHSSLDCDSQLDQICNFWNYFGNFLGKFSLLYLVTLYDPFSSDCDFYYYLCCLFERFLSWVVEI